MSGSLQTFDDFRTDYEQAVMDKRRGLVITHIDQLHRKSKTALVR